MANLFPDGSDALLRVGLVCVFLAGAALVLVPTIYVRTPFHTHQLFPVGQPVEFDHRHHVQDDGIDCRYCHNQVERAPMAGLPSTSTCMGCHGQIWQQTDTTEINTYPKEGDTLEIRKEVLGGYMCDVNKYQSVHCKRVK